MKTALLLSGGMDSVSIAYWKKPDLTICIDYGQKPAEAELRASRAVAEYLQLKYESIRVDCSSLGSGDLTDSRALDHAPSSEWWPYRNQLLVTLALMKCASYGITELMLGTVDSDGHHADGTPAFVNAIGRLVKMQEGGPEITAPAINYSTAELVKVSKIPLSVLAFSHSCHASNFACGVCRGCIKHRNTYHELGDLPY